MSKFTGLIIMDGFGLNTQAPYNAIEAGKNAKYVYDLMSQYPSTELQASGLAVGLPEGQMGNSEVGHLNMGAGRVIYQELTRITKSIEDGDFFEKPEFLDIIENCKKTGKNLHILGLCSDGGVHSTLTHIFALIKLAKDNGLKNVFVHAFLDGRDVPPESGLEFIETLEAYMKGINFGKIATVSGRFYAMDRDNMWERVEKAYSALVDGEGVQAANAQKAVADSYKAGVTDEFVLPTVISRCGKPVATINAGDGVIFANFRPDRARMITRAFIFEDFKEFARKKGFLGVKFASMTMYDVKFDGKLQVAFKPESYTNTFGEYIADKGLKQFRIAETQKYAHVTFFFNGGVEAPNKNEDRYLIDSPKIATFDLKPAMSAYEVADKAVEIIKSKAYDVMILNFANCDMVGHTGVFKAAEEAVAVVSECVEKVINAIKEIGGVAVLTADHGNADFMFEEDGTPFTAHTTNPVPFVIIDDNMTGKKLKEGGRLCDVAPTMLQIMGLPKPKEMTGESLL